MRIKILEMTYKRPKVKDAIDDHMQQVVENWCLIWVASHHDWHRETINHWAGELVAQLDPGRTKLLLSGLSTRAQHKLIEEVLVSDAKLDQVWVVEEMLRAKFAREGIKEFKSEAARAWVAEGLDEIRAVYRRDVELDDYEQQLCAVE